MTIQSQGKLNRLEQLLPEGLVVDSAWLTAAGYSPALRSQYVDAGWLEQPIARVYRRGRGPLRWQQVVISLQTLLRRRLVVGGRTSLELQGYTHYLSGLAGNDVPSEVHLYGPMKPPTWLANMPLMERFVYHNSTPLFGDDLTAVSFPTLCRTICPDPGVDKSLAEAGLRSLPWGESEWPLTLSTSERAILELLDELPHGESFHQVDVLMEGLSDLSPRRLQSLLVRCRSVKVKRLFFFFADRHNHAWLKHLDRASVDLGSGKRSLVAGGRLDKTYQITVPRDLEETR